MGEEAADLPRAEDVLVPEGFGVFVALLLLTPSCPHPVRGQRARSSAAVSHTSATNCTEAECGAGQTVQQPLSCRRWSTPPAGSARRWLFFILCVSLDDQRLPTLPRLPATPLGSGKPRSSTPRAGVADLRTCTVPGRRGVSRCAPLQALQKKPRGFGGRGVWSWGHFPQSEHRNRMFPPRIGSTSVSTL